MSKKYNMAHRVTHFIIGLHNLSSGYTILSSGYTILVPGYKFRSWQFEIQGYTRTVGGRRGLWHACNVRPLPHPQADKNIYKYFYWGSEGAGVVWHVLFFVVFVVSPSKRRFLLHRRCNNKLRRIVFTFSSFQTERKVLISISNKSKINVKIEDFPRHYKVLIINFMGNKESCEE